MCKIMMLAGIRPSKTVKAWKWACAAAPLLYAHDNDGFGYVAVAQGELFGERWLNAKDTFKRRVVQTRAERFTSAQFGSAVSLADTYNRFGDVALAPHAQAIMLHARFATCAKSLRNTHPFTLSDEEGKLTHALIHNGVISNASALTNRTSSCDSECILNEYEDAGIARIPESIQDVADVLRGYYACGVFAHDGSEQIMDVFKSERASLYVSWVPALGTHVFCTSEEIIRATARKCRMKLANMAEVNEGALVRLSVETGRVLSVTEFEDGPTAIKEFLTEGEAKKLMAVSRGGR